MLNTRSLLYRAGILVVAVLTTGFLVQISRAMSAPSGEGAADLIRIDAVAQFDTLELPPAVFRHDKHTTALKDADCATCHKSVDGKLVLLFQRTEDKSGEQLKDVYHTNCIGCHTDMAQKAQQAGPIASECRSCHAAAEPDEASAWQEIGMDKSLHYRHIAAESIQPTGGVDVNCGTCHHVYDNVAEKTVWKQGEEDSCRSCHKAEPTLVGGVTVSAFADAAHQQCVVCHVSMAEAKADTGPVTCGGCHTLEAQAKIKTIDNVPRLMRGQPDATILTPATAEDAGKRKLGPDAMPAVAFNHKVHEQANDTCRVCHHEKIAQCTTCHTTEGKAEGNFIQLSQAMHSKQSDASCIGCHNQQKKQPVCAGCHAAIPEKTAADTASCVTCHNVPVSLAPQGAQALSQDERVSAGKLVASTRTYTETYSMDDIPERVTIDALVDEYEAVDFPHRKIVKTMVAGIKDSRLATAFHTDPGVFCQGCHHNSPVSKTPPACITCHGKSVEPAQGGRPGLKAAYHQQCMSCHAAMQIEKPANTACNECHKKRDL